jgi:23S rRNA pseudouridine1911/1915/1917 synthase
VGHPVVGDPVYGGARRTLPLGRPFLHAAGLAFVHPVTGAPVEVTELLPPELEELVDQLDEAVAGP